MTVQPEPNIRTSRNSELVEQMRASEDPGLRRVGELFCSLGFTPLVVDRDILEGRENVGNVDLVFEYGTDVLVVEVSTQRADRNEKLFAWFTKWSDDHLLTLLRERVQVGPGQRFFRVYIDLSRNNGGPGVSLIPPDLRNPANHNGILFLDDIKYFEDIRSKVKDFARYDLLAYLGLKPPMTSLRINHAIQFYMSDVYALSFVISAETLLSSAYVFRRRGFSGYQRFLNFKRIEDIERKIREGRILSFPNSILINMEQDVLIDPRRSPEDCPAACRFDFPTDYCSSRIIDGQHRMMGIARLPQHTRESISLQVIAFPRLELDREIKTFVEINNNQNKVDRNLVFNLIGDFEWPAGSKESYQKTAVLAARQLRQRGILPLFLGAADEERKGKIALATLVTTLTTTGLLGSRGNVWQDREFDELSQLFIKIKNPKTRFSTAWKEFLISNRGVRILLRLMYLLERNRSAGTISLTNSDLVGKLKGVADDELLTQIKLYVGHGGADAAVRDIVARLQERYSDELGSFALDLRSLRQATHSRP